MEQLYGGPATLCARDIHYREFRPGDEAAILDCLDDEYGNTYYRRDYYRAGYYTEMTADQKMRIFLAQTPDGATAGFLVARRSDGFRGQIELGTMIIRQACRGYRLSEPFIRYAMNRLKDESCSALFGHTQMFHTISQKNLYQLDLIPTGLLLSTILSAPLRHSFRQGAGKKLAWGVMVRPQDKRHAGTLYVPEELKPIIAGLYNGMNLPFSFAPGGAVGDRGSLRCYDDADQHTGTAVIDAFDPTGAAEIAAKLRAREQDPLYTMNVLLNGSHPSAVEGYGALAAQGFFFTGMQPACDRAEYLLMHHPMRVPVVFSDFQVSAAFSGIVAMVQKQYQFGGGDSLEKRTLHRC